ncbi:hypothetical protein BgiBS90_022469, partial [Biomphalaria glabrata]
MSSTRVLWTQHQTLSQNECLVPEFCGLSTKRLPKTNNKYPSLVVSAPNAFPKRISSTRVLWTQHQTPSQNECQVPEFGGLSTKRLPKTNVKYPSFVDSAPNAFPKRMSSTRVWWTQHQTPSQNECQVPEFCGLSTKRLPKTNV